MILKLYGLIDVITDVGGAERMNVIQVSFRSWKRYIVAVLVVGVAFVVRAEVLQPLGNNVPYVTFYPAVMLAAQYGGLSAGLVASVLSAALVMFWIIGISQPISLSRADWLGMLVFLIACTMVSLLCAAMQRDQMKLKQRTVELSEVNSKLEREIAERKQIELTLRKLDRLNVVGEIAAGIGHEVRNPLTTVRGYLQWFNQKEKLAEYHDQFSLMMEELDRANAIITEFLSLAKDKAVEMKRGNLTNVIHVLFPLLQADAFRKGHNIVLDTVGIPECEFDEKEIRQMILNLVRNSLEAMEESGEVTIRIFQENNSIVLAVQDKGPGIPAEIIDKLGTPFITTKDGGTGLGLPICYRIAERHRAKIDVDTGPMGTTFSVIFNSAGSCRVSGSV